ncbi:uncharacterized protein [Diabrotica undecimpunctata]|uniref:uncharacterized protein n=1 Tax=Diabrotica undecimpunctata TaxID=50387 RepID=UPI003B63F723
MTKKEEAQLRPFDRKILRKEYGLMQEKYGTWRIRRNDEVNELNEGYHIIRYVKSQRLSWLGYIQRHEDTKTTKKMLQLKPVGRRKKERPRTRWLDDVEDDLKTMNIRQ